MTATAPEATGREHDAGGQPRAHAFPPGSLVAPCGYVRSPLDRPISRRPRCPRCGEEAGRKQFVTR